MYLNNLYINRIRDKLTAGLTALTIALSTLMYFPSHALAACIPCDTSISLVENAIWIDAEENFDDKIDEEFVRVEEFIIHEMWEQSILPIMMLATEQLTAVAMQQAMAIGMFIDAESQMNAQRLLQELRAKTHKDYQPSIGMCEFGSIMKSLAATEIRGEVNAVILSQRSLDRQLGLRDSAGMHGHDLDHHPRIKQFKILFCDEKDRASVLETVCTNSAWSSGGSNADDKRRMNKDIDYFSLVDSPWNLSLDFSNKEIIKTSAPAIYNDDEEHILAMAANLFAHNTFPRIPGKLLENHPKRSLTPMQKAYMDMRSLVAKRSVAENSFYAISAMKARSNDATAPSGAPAGCVGGAGVPGPTCTAIAASGGAAGGSGKYGGADSVATGAIGGPPSSLTYLENILSELGVPTAETLVLLGDHPSYYAQMEVITKKLYQNPDFYTNLYDTPANIERKTVALQAIKLMQKFDMLKSFLRNEASTSILLELEVSNLQNEIEDQIQDIDTRGGN